MQPPGWFWEAQCDHHSWIRCSVAGIGQTCSWVYGDHAAGPGFPHGSRRTRGAFSFIIPFKCLFTLTFSPLLLSCSCASVLSSAAKHRCSDIMHSFFRSVRTCLWSIFNLDPNLQIFRSRSTLRRPSYSLSFFPFPVALIDGVEGFTLPAFILYGNALRALASVLQSSRGLFQSAVGHAAYCAL